MTSDAGNTTGLVTTARSNPGKMEYRPLEREETAVLNTVIGQIKESPYNSEAQNQLIGNAIAEACARTHCGEGVPESDEHYKTLQTLQQRGEALVENGQNMLANDAELFDYGWIDSKQDSLRANDEVITRVEGGAQGVLGAYGAAAGTVATVATSPACVSVVGCVAPAATAGLTALSANASLDGFNQMLSEYQSTFGEEVLNNLSADNYQDPSNPAGDLAIAAGTEVLLGATGRAAEKVADVADGIVTSARSSKNADNIAQNSALDDMGDAFEGSVGAAKAKDVDIESALATGYTKNADGSVTGPRGGNYQSTGQVDVDGNPIYTNSGKYYTLDGKNTQVGLPNKSNTNIENAYHAKSSPKVTKSVLDRIDPKYFDTDARFGKGFYIAEKGKTAVAEIGHHGTEASHVIRYQVDLSETKVLDLSDPKVANKWNYKRNSSNDYTDSKVLSKQAQEQGYEAIRFPSERGAGNNLVIFKNFDEILSSQAVSPVK